MGMIFYDILYKEFNLTLFNQRTLLILAFSGKKQGLVHVPTYCSPRHGDSRERTTLFCHLFCIPRLAIHAAANDIQLHLKIRHDFTTTVPKFQDSGTHQTGNSSNAVLQFQSGWWVGSHRQAKMSLSFEDTNPSIGCSTHPAWYPELGTAPVRPRKAYPLDLRDFLQWCQ